MTSTSSTSVYDPDSTAIPGANFSAALLSTRDLSIQIPINFVTHPSVVLSTCFPDKVYEDTVARKCLSNLLAGGFRRVVVDLYWDTSRSVWSLCPVQLGSVGDDASSSTTGSTTSTTSTASITSASITTTQDAVDEIVQTSLSSAVLEARASDTISALSLVDRAVAGTSSADPTSTSASASATAASNANETLVSTSPEALYKVGDYECTTTIDLSLIDDVFVGHFTATGYNINATLDLMILNLHVASTSDGEAVTPDSSQLPAAGSISDLLSSSVTTYLYTPVSLAKERSDLNSSWFAVDSDYQPNYAYIDMYRTASGNVATYSGWPCEAYIELLSYKRLLLGYGTVDSALSEYDVSDDDDTIFAPGLLSTFDNVTISGSGGNVTSGCFFDPSLTEDDLVVSRLNNTWAISENEFLPSADKSLTTIDYQASNMTACGISPLLDLTLDNVSAGVNATAYSEFSRNSVWSWMPGQPNDQTSQAAIQSDSHCAVMNLTSNGQWHVAPCNDHHYAACRIDSTPYLWTVTSQSGAYDAVSRVCPDNSSFGVPHTALENSYLYATMQTSKSENLIGDSDILIWLNFNDLDVSGCWVIGTNSTCPYVSHTVSETRRVIVPTVAAILVFALAGLTLFIKLAANRGQSRRRRKRADDGWDYEGVPS